MILRIKNTVIRKIQRILKKNGLKIAKFPEPEKARRITIINYFGIQTIFDIGANIGSYGQEIREMGFKGKIFSFEPTKEAFSYLQKKCRKDLMWECFPWGLGEEEKELPIHLSVNSKSSSILNILPLSLESAPDSRVKELELIKVKTLNQVFQDLGPIPSGIMFKIDTQGFEKNVLLGAKDVLMYVDVIQMELSFESLYSGESTFWEMIQWMDQLGYELYALETDLSFTNPKTGKMLQVDCIFARKGNLHIK